MYNEAQVAQRVIDAACALDYPKELLQVQVLDDSTDGSAQIAQQRVAYWAKQGINIQFLHREIRTGFKAGALEAGLSEAHGQFIAIFDADFVPPPGFLKRTIHHFTNPRVGMVQARWGHLNRADSLLTRCQAIFLAGHFLIEHTARNRSDRWINFNGTAGVWRREAIESAGGWQHDTLTEDVDLSYRAQLAGWDFIFLPRVECPAELPTEINAFKAQQHRWTKGSIQTAKKLLVPVLRANVPLGVKVEAFFHLTSPMVYLYITLMALLFYPAFYVNMQPFEGGSIGSVVLGMSIFALGTASAGVFYTVSQSQQRRGVFTTILQLPMLMSIGIGIALNNARGCIEALFGVESDFVRTPKYNSLSGDSPSTASTGVKDGSVIPTPSIKTWMVLLEIGMGLYTLQCARLAMASKGTLVSVPFLLLFSVGYLYVGLTGLHSQWQSRRVWRALTALPS
jgi:cellulose synthase/poly-beta-1,6-N-acetylglucosamine synthase-like glycosyltransferase